MCMYKNVPVSGGRVVGITDTDLLWRSVPSTGIIREKKNRKKERPRRATPTL